MLYCAEYLSPLGKIFAASDGTNLIGLWFEGQRYFPEDINQFISDSSLPVFKVTFRWLDFYFAGRVPDFIPPIDFIGVSDFRKYVFKILLQIPYGNVISYKDIVIALKREFGINSCARAVGGAVGRNPISIIVPCHRVIAADGRLSGYAGGVDKKLCLLKLEGINVHKFNR